jgi:hypothetical protein
MQQKGLGSEKSSEKGVNRKEMFPQSSAHKPYGLGKIKEHAPRFEHVHLHQDVGHIHENQLQAALLPQLSKNYKKARARQKTVVTTKHT